MFGPNRSFSISVTFVLTCLLAHAHAQIIFMIMFINFHVHVHVGLFPCSFLFMLIYVFILIFMFMFILMPSQTKGVNVAGITNPILLNPKTTPKHCSRSIFDGTGGANFFLARDDGGHAHRQPPRVAAMLDLYTFGDALIAPWKLLFQS